MNRKPLVISLLIVVIFISGCTSTDNTSPLENKTQMKDNPSTISATITSSKENCRNLSETIHKDFSDSIFVQPSKFTSLSYFFDLDDKTKNIIEGEFVSDEKEVVLYIFNQFGYSAWVEEFYYKKDRVWASYPYSVSSPENTKFSFSPTETLVYYFVFHNKRANETVALGGLGTEEKIYVNPPAETNLSFRWSFNKVEIRC